MGCYQCGSEGGSKVRLCAACIRERQSRLEQYRQGNIQDLLQTSENEKEKKARKRRLLKLCLFGLFGIGFLIVVIGGYLFQLKYGFDAIHYRLASNSSSVEPSKPVVVNELRSCPPGTLKARPDICGCNVPDDDSDGDGFPDCNDPCPRDLLKIKPGQCGCGISDFDSDHDGYADCIDLCPNDPYKNLPGECGCGRSDTDSDRDGMADCIDNCPFTPNPFREDTYFDGIGDVCRAQYFSDVSMCFQATQGAASPRFLSNFEFAVPTQQDLTFILSTLGDTLVKVNIRLFKPESSEVLFNQEMTLPTSFSLRQWKPGVYELGFYESSTSSAAEMPAGRFCIKVLGADEEVLPVRVVMQIGTGYL